MIDPFIMNINKLLFILEEIQILNQIHCLQSNIIYYSNTFATKIFIQYGSMAFHPFLFQPNF